MTKKQALYKTAKINTCGNDLSKRWYVFYSTFDTEALKFVVHKNYAGVNRLQSVDARRFALQRIADEINQELALKFGSASEPKPILIIDALEAAIASKKILRAKSFSTYRNHGYHLIDWLKKNSLQGMKASAFSRMMALEFLDKMASKGIGARTYNNYLTFCRTLFNAMMERELIASNPFDAIKKLRSTPQTHSVFSDNEQSEAINYMRLHEAGLLLFVCFEYYCFIRPFELIQLKVSAVDTKRYTITIPSEISKNGKTQTVLIPSAFRAQVENMQLKQLNKNWFLMGSKFTPGPQQMKRDTATKKHREVMDNLRMRNELTLYSWKHTGAVRSVQAGVNIKELQLQLRHHSLDQVNTYLRDLGLTQNSQLPDKFPAIF